MKTSTASVMCDIMAHTGGFGLDIPAQLLKHLNQLKHTQWAPHLISALNHKYFSAGIKEEASHIPCTVSYTYIYVYIISVILEIRHIINNAEVTLIWEIVRLLINNDNSK